MARYAALMIVLASASFVSAEPPDAGPWTPTVDRLVRVCEEGYDSLDEAGHAALATELKAIQRTLATRHGVVLRDAILTPDGVPLLLPALMSRLHPDQDARQRESFAQLLDAHAEAWTAAARKTEGQTPRQRQAGLLGASIALEENLGEALDFQGSAECATVVRICLAAAGPRFRITESNRTEAPAKLAALWSAELALDPRHAPAVETIAATFCEDLDLSTRKARSVKDLVERARLALAPQIRAQESLLALELSEVERAAVRAWETLDLVLPEPLPQIVAPGDPTMGVGGGGIRKRDPKAAPPVEPEEAPGEEMESEHGEGPSAD